MLPLIQNLIALALKTILFNEYEITKNTQELIKKLERKIANPFIVNLVCYTKSNFPGEAVTKSSSKSTIIIDIIKASATQSFKNGIKKIKRFFSSSYQKILFTSSHFQIK